MESSDFVQFTSQVTLALLILSIALVFVRLDRGPQAADRIVSLDLISVMIVAFLGAYAVYMQDTSFLDVALAYALIAFLGTVALSRFLLRAKRQKDQSKTQEEDS